MCGKIRILSVDDNEINLALVEELSRQLDFEVFSFTSAFEAVKFAAGNEIDMALVDYIMPQMDGIELIGKLKKLQKEMYIIMITQVHDDNVVKMRAFQKGATEFLNKPLNPVEFKARLYNLAKLRQYQMMNRDRSVMLQNEVKRATISLQLREYEALKIIGRAAEFKDCETANHVDRVANYSKIIAGNESEETKDILFYASQLHDIGKIGIRDAILLKEGRLDNDELSRMQEHCTIGYKILEDSESIYLQAGAQIALSHHEKFNGTGYPNKLKGDDIPLFGRIVAIADVFDALLSNRPYKKPWPFENAVDYIISEKGGAFDPEKVGVFVSRLDEIRKFTRLSETRPSGNGKTDIIETRG